MNIQKDLFIRLFIVFGMLTCTPMAHAQDGVTSAQITVSTTTAEDDCEAGPSNKQWTLTMGALILGTIVMGGIGISTLSRSLAGSGYRQSAANMAGLGMGATVGGAIGAGLMISDVCGVVNLPGGISAAVFTMGLLALVFSLATGKAR